MNIFIDEITPYNEQIYLTNILEMVYNDKTVHRIYDTQTYIDLLRVIKKDMETHHYFIIRYRHLPLGFIFYNKLVSPSLFYLYIKKQYRNMGLGTFVMKQIHNTNQRLYMISDKEDIKSIDFIKKYTDNLITKENLILGITQGMIKQGYNPPPYQHKVV